MHYQWITGTSLQGKFDEHNGIYSVFQKQYNNHPKANIKVPHSDGFHFLHYSHTYTLNNVFNSGEMNKYLRQLSILEIINSIYIYLLVGAKPSYVFHGCP